MFGSRRTRKGARARALFAHFAFRASKRQQCAGCRDWAQYGFAPLAVYSPSCVVRRDPRKLDH